MQNQTTGVRHTEGLLHFGYTSLPVIGLVSLCTEILIYVIRMATLLL